MLEYFYYLLEWELSNNMLTKEEFEDLKKKEKILKEASNVLRVKDEDLPKVLKRFLNEIEEMKRKLNER